MKSKTLVIFSVFAFMLTSCNKELRADIAEFISNFSLENAVENYKKAQAVVVLDVDKHDEIYKTIETTTIDISDASAPQYRHQTDRYEGKEYEFKSTTVTYLSYEEDKIYFVVNDDSKSEMSLEEAHKMVKTFFYKETALDDQYHNRGYYHGDNFRNSAYYYQNYITIDQENELLLFELNRSDSRAEESSKIVLDKWGMMLENIAIARSGDEAVSTTITVTKL